MTEHINIQPTKLLKILKTSGFDIEYTKDNYLEWLEPLTDIGVDPIIYSSILNTLDTHQWKNFYIYLYSKWQRIISFIEEEQNIKFESLPVYSNNICYNSVLKDFCSDISRLIFIVNSLQIYFIPYPN
jgi:hypothetical protein